MPTGIFNLKQQIQEIAQGAWSGQKTPAVEYLVVAGGVRVVLIELEVAEQADYCKVY